MSRLADDKLVKKAFYTLCQLHNCGFTTWASKVLKIQEQYGLTESLANLSDFANLDTVVKLCKDSIEGFYMSKWKSSLTVFPILRTYCLFKSDFIF